MRPFLKRFRWLLVADVVLGLIVVAIALDLGLTRHVSGEQLPPTAGAAARLVAYDGVGSWVDIFDAKAWHDPAGTVADMASHGVRTLYVETASPSSSSGLADPSALGAFITQAHARHMYVVAWYPPSMHAGSGDLDRIMQAVEFTTSDGQKFDSVALDIESTSVKRIATRNSRIRTLSEQLRSRVGSDYPLGAIIPSPVGLRKKTGFWNVFPYGSLAKTYDVLLPMAYYTYHGHGAAAASADAVASMRILRAQPGCKTIPVHLIGGLAGDSTAAEVSGFAHAARKTGCIGTSLYDWVGTSPAQWRQLAAGWGTAAP